MSDWITPLALLTTGIFTSLLLWQVLRKNSALPETDLAKLLQEESRQNRQEITTTLHQNKQELHHILEQAHQATQENKEQVKATLKELQEALTQSIKELNQLQKEKLDTLQKKQEELVAQTQDQLEKVRTTVDEQLHKTLEERLGRSFQLVSHRLEAVQKGLGEMQKLAHDVGDLKSVLTNVKTRGTLGEIQLENILAEVMAPQQYAANVQTKPRSAERVEFAIKLPGKENGQFVYLPIDAKFPQEAYIRLQNAQEEGNGQAVALARKALIQSIKKSAKEIQAKYIEPPYTTDFGILFLSTEGIFAEVLRDPDLIAIVQREYKIVITGPTTLAAMLNSLQMGFKTLAIQKRSSEVWEVLAAVKGEFSKFGTVLEKAQSKLQEANTQLDKLVGQRTRMMLSKLKKIENLPSGKDAGVLPTALEDQVDPI